LNFSPQQQFGIFQKIQKKQLSESDANRILQQKKKSKPVQERRQQKKTQTIRPNINLTSINYKGYSLDFSKEWKDLSLFSKEYVTLKTVLNLLKTTYPQVKSLRSILEFNGIYTYLINALQETLSSQPIINIGNENYRFSLKKDPHQIILSNANPDIADIVSLKMVQDSKKSIDLQGCNDSKLSLKLDNTGDEGIYMNIRDMLIQLQDKLKCIVIAMN
jgi:hypothetical protein